jgi:hypothetical protein
MKADASFVLWVSNSAVSGREPCRSRLCLGFGASLRFGGERQVHFHGADSVGGNVTHHEADRGCCEIVLDRELGEDAESNLAAVCGSWSY